MSNEVQAFFDHWIDSDLLRRMSASGPCPTPMAMIAGLCADAAAAGISENDLQHEIGDLFEAMMRAMMSVPDLGVGCRQIGEGGRMHGVLTPAAAMRLAMSYLEGLRDTLGDDVDLAADLVLCNLAQQGFRIMPWNDGSDTVSLRSMLARYHGDASDPTMDLTAQPLPEPYAPAVPIETNGVKPAKRLT